VVCPEINPHCLKRIPYNQPHHIPLLLESIHVLVRSLLLYVLNYSDNIHHLALYPLAFMLPPEITVFVLRFNYLVLYFLYFVVLLLQSNLRSSFDFLALE
jgi:hypothetical protein